MTRAEHRERYRTDPVWRAAKIARNRESQVRREKDPLYKELVATRKRVYTVRESYEARLAHAERLFKKLEKLIAKKERLTRLWKQAKVTHQHPAAA